jgi:hypothetical protein
MMHLSQAFTWVSYFCRVLGCAKITHLQFFGAVDLAVKGFQAGRLTA